MNKYLKKAVRLFEHFLKRTREEANPADQRTRIFGLVWFLFLMAYQPL